MKAAFADTFYFCALLNRADAAHEAAVAQARSNSQPLVTTVLVSTELANAFAETKLRKRAAEFIRVIEGSRQLRAVPLTTELWEASLRLYEARPDKEWSLTDCCSFVVMEQEGLTVALTGDRHFVQAGFEAVFV
jgi:predicted nucleic acid-binding protein